MEGDFEMAAGAPMGITHEELEEIDSESHFCLLCHFCSDVNRGEVAAGVNQDIHQLVEFAAEFRSKYSLEVTAGLLHDYYMTHLKDMEEYRNFPEWTKKTVYKHLLKKRFQVTRLKWCKHSVACKDAKLNLFLSSAIFFRFGFN